MESKYKPLIQRLEEILAEMVREFRELEANIPDSDKRKLPGDQAADAEETSVDSTKGVSKKT